MSLCVVMLAYNEAENLKVLIPKVKRELEKINEQTEIMIIDVKDSKDDTESVCKKEGVKYYNQLWPGFGGAMKTAIKYAKTDKFLIMDSDGSHNPRYITDIYNKFEEGTCDVCIGSRYTKGGKTYDKKTSIIMSKILNTIFRFCLGINAKDISTNFRIYKTEDLKKIHLTCKNYDVLEEILLKLKILKSPNKLVIEEIPITFDKRVYGESKRQLLPFIISYIKTLIRLVAMRIKYNCIKKS